MIQLFWGSQPAYGLITGYRVEKAINGGPWSTLTVTANSIFTFDDNAVSSGNTYNYRLFIVTNNGDYLQIDELSFYFV